MFIWQEAYALRSSASQGRLRTTHKNTGGGEVHKHERHAERVRTHSHATRNIWFPLSYFNLTKRQQFKSIHTEITVLQYCKVYLLHDATGEEEEGLTAHDRLPARLHGTPADNISPEVQGCPSCWCVQQAAHLSASPLERALGTGAKVRPRQENEGSKERTSVLIHHLFGIFGHAGTRRIVHISSTEHRPRASETRL